MRNLLCFFLFLVGILVFAISAPPVFAQNKCGVNVGPYYGQVGQVRDLTKEGGWIVALGTLGDCAGYGSLFDKGLNVVLRAYNAGQAFDADQALAWTATLGQLDTKGQMIYFMPWNEPNQGSSEGGNSTDGTAVMAYLQTLKTHLQEAGLLNTKVVLLSPMLNKTHPDFYTYLNSVGGANNIYEVGKVGGTGGGSSINEYDVAVDRNNYIACQNSEKRHNNCRYDQISIPGPYYALESGVTGIYGVPRYEDQHIAKMLNGSWLNNDGAQSNWQKDSFKMFAVFSYDPIPGGPAWNIFNAGQTRSFYNDKCSTGSVTPLSNFVQRKFDDWLIANKTKLVECGSCGFAPVNAAGWCSGVGQDQPGYDTSIYDDYNASDEEYYLHPIAGLSGSRSLTTIRNDLINQGYQAYCATPGFRIGYSQSGGQKLSEYINAANEGYNEGRGIGFGAERLYRDLGYKYLPYYSTLTVDYREVLTPVFRDVSGKRFLTTSLEEFMGFKDTVLQENPAAELSSAAVNSLLSNQQRCEQSINILLAQEIMCNKLQTPSACPLYPRAISGTNYTIKSLIDAYKGFVTSPPADLTLNPQVYDNKETAGQVCAYLLLHDANSQLKTGLLYTPLTIDRAYRLGFLVTSIENKFAPQANRSMFNLFAHPNEGWKKDGPGKPKHTVLVNAFKIPDILTNSNSLTDNGPSSARTSWNDPSLITANTLQTSAQKIAIKEEKSTYLSTISKSASAYDTASQSAASEIFCVTGTGRGLVGAESCRDELSKAVIDIINATASLSKQGDKNFDYFQPTCPNLEKESASTIQDDGAFGNVETIYTNPTKGTLFNTQFGGELLKRIFDIPEENVTEAVDLDETHQVKPKGKSHPAFAETWRKGDPEIINKWENPVRDWGLKTVFYVIPEMETLGWPYTKCCDEVEVRHYLVYPVGYDMDTVQTFLAGSFFSSDQLIDLAKTAQDYDRIELAGDQINFEGATMTEEFENWLHKCWHTDCDEDGTHCKRVYREPCDDSIGFNVNQVGENYPAGLLGAKFGYYLRAIQKGLSGKVSVAMDYLNSCQSTEQFLTGKCGESLDPVAKPGPAECTDLSCGRAPKPQETAQPPEPQLGCARGERGREMCIRDGKLYIYDHNVDISGDGTADEHCGGHVTVDSSSPPGCKLVKQPMWGFSSPGGPLSENLGCSGLTQVTATFDSTAGSCSQQTLSVVAN